MLTPRRLFRHLEAARPRDGNRARDRVAPNRLNSAAPHRTAAGARRASTPIYKFGKHAGLKTGTGNLPGTFAERTLMSDDPDHVIA